MRSSTLSTTALWLTAAVLLVLVAVIVLAAVGEAGDAFDGMLEQ